jgi:hypothetical protein
LEPVKMKVFGNVVVVLLPELTILP